MYSITWPEPSIFADMVIEEGYDRNESYQQSKPDKNKRYVMINNGYLSRKKERIGR